MTLRPTDHNWSSNKTTRPREKRAEASVTPCQRAGCVNKAGRYVRDGRRFCSGDCLRVAAAGGGK